MDSERAGAAPLPGGQCLQATGLGYRFPGSSALVLEGVECSLARGELVAILGPNGAGKTCLLRLLAGLCSPSLGQVRLDGRPLPGRSERWFAYVSQGFEPRFPFTVLESVLMGLPERGFYDRPADLQRAHAALARVGAEGLASRRLEALSGGERRRVVLARALAQKSPFLLLDEPTEALDPAHRLAFFEILRAQAQQAGTAVLVASHHLDLSLRYCDRVLVLAQGRCAAQGPPSQALNREVLLQAFGVEGRVYEGWPDFPVPTLGLRLPPSA